MAAAGGCWTGLNLPAGARAAHRRSRSCLNGPGQLRGRL